MLINKTREELVEEVLSQDPELDPASNDQTLIYYGAGINIHLGELLRIAGPTIEDILEARDHEPACF